LSTAPRNDGDCIEQGASGVLLGANLHVPPLGGGGAGVGSEPGAGVGVAVGAGAPSVGVGFGSGITTGIASGDWVGAGVGSVGLVGMTSLSAWHPLKVIIRRATAATRFAEKPFAEPNTITGTSLNGSTLSV